MVNSKPTEKPKIPKYRDHWRNFLALHGIAGLAAGQAVAAAGGGWACALVGLGLGLWLAHYRARVAPGDLTDWQIADLEDVITPISGELIEPDSYDVTLGENFLQLMPDGSAKEIKTKELVIGPGECWLAHTVETFRFPNNLKGTLQGKSSWARLSLFVECAGLFDKGFEGTAVLELYNAGRWGILLKEGDRIAQMSFHRTLRATAAYGSPLRKSHYQKQEGARGSWLSKTDRVIPVTADAP